MEEQKHSELNAIDVSSTHVMATTQLKVINYEKKDEKKINADIKGFSENKSQPISNARDSSGSSNFLSYGRDLVQQVIIQQKDSLPTTNSQKLREELNKSRNDIFEPEKRVESNHNLSQSSFYRSKRDDAATPDEGLTQFDKNILSNLQSSIVLKDENNSYSSASNYSKKNRKYVISGNQSNDNYQNNYNKRISNKSIDAINSRPK